MDAETDGAGDGVMDGVSGDIGFPPEQEITKNAANAHISAVCKICLREFILIFLPLENYTTNKDGNPRNGIRGLH
jgi:hypothetical protein